jgi:DNA-binding transcriptional ArsR family regulator
MLTFRVVDTALKALAEPRRQEILRLVWSAEMPASRIAARFEDITRSAVSQHLGVLRGADLVIERRHGTRRLYRANHAEMTRLRNFLDEFWTDGLERLRELAEDAEQTSEPAPVAITPDRTTEPTTDPTTERTN